MEEQADGYNSEIFDFKAFVFRTLSYWKWFLLILIISFYVVYHQNIRKEFPYTLEASITVQDDKNPLFTSNTSLVFNYGGISGKVQDVLLNLKSRKHHEKVVDSLNLCLSYLKQGRFYKTDIYKKAPFEFVGLDSAYQVTGKIITVEFVSENEFELSYNFDESQAVSAQNFKTKEVKSIAVNEPVFTKIYKFGDFIDLPFLKGKIIKKENHNIKIGEQFFIKYANFNATVSSFIRFFNILNEKSSPLLRLRLSNKNKSKIVDYLNTCVFILERDQLQRKNQYAINTINFIDEQLARVKGELTENADSLNDFKRNNKIFDIVSESKLLVTKKEEYKEQKEGYNNSLLSYDLLKNYLVTSNDFTNFPAPAMQGITDKNIVANISRIIALSAKKSKLEYSVRNDVSIFNDLNRQIEGLKNVLLENIASVKANIGYQIKALDSKIYGLEKEFSLIPENKQKLTSIQRQYSLSERTYGLYLAKRGEANLIRASNISDITFIEPAKDTGQPRNAVNLNIRYVFAFLAALLPLVLISFVVTFFDNKIHMPNNLESLTSIPILGVIGMNLSENNLAVFNSPKSPVAEAFRAIRSSLQFMYKQHDVESTKTLMLTSSVSGEGKTFSSINIATVFALSGKKTVLLGLDLRKPKIFEDFSLKNNLGVVNYLIGQENLEGIKQSTKIDNLDVILSGPIPPNPSELLLSDKMGELIKELKTKYDYIVLDTPPVGLVADAMELLPYVDATLYVVRQDYTKKDMLNLINTKFKKGEINNISLLYNGYDQKGKYGYGYGYGYSYGGYGGYGNGYHEDIITELSFLEKIKHALRLDKTNK